MIEQQPRANERGHLNVLSIFLTVDGEANEWHPGTWSVFIRLTGCRVGCHWCDTKYSWTLKQGKQMTPAEILEEVGMIGKGATKVTITGGEPLEQDGEEMGELLLLLSVAGYNISIESAGTHDIRGIFNHCDMVNFVLDYKLKSARARVPNFLENYQVLGTRDVIKFVVDSRADFEEAVQVCRDMRFNHVEARMVMSPSFGNVHPGQLFQWMKESDCPSLGVGLNLQLHKFLFAGDRVAFRMEEGSGLDFSREGMKKHDPS